MLTRLKVRNFKLFEQIDLELDQHVVFVGPNNSGKTTALQALTLWEVGKNRWLEKRGGEEVPKKRPGVAIGRRDSLALPVPSANLLWRNLRTRNVRRENGEQRTDNVLIEIVVEGNSFVSRGNQSEEILGAKELTGNFPTIDDDGQNERSTDLQRSYQNGGYEDWSCGLEFYYANEESFYCRPQGLTASDPPQVPEAVKSVRFAYLPPMSGLAANETRLGSGAINVRIGEGRTAEVLRNLCYQLWEYPNGEFLWEQFCDRIKELFGCQINEPVLSAERDEITMNYKTSEGVTLDISASGRGQQQIMLLLSYMAANPGCILLMDEPDAHLEILRQRQTYQILRQAVVETNSQLIIASHSEVVLNEAEKGSDTLIAFTGRRPHLVDTTSQVMKSLSEIGFEHYQQAEQRGWVMYLEGPNDLAVLREFAEHLDHAAKKYLSGPFVEYVANQPKLARKHFYGVNDAFPTLQGIAIYDHLDFQLDLNQDSRLRELCWEKCEIENYLYSEEALLRFAEKDTLQLEGRLTNGDLESRREGEISTVQVSLFAETCLEAMRRSIEGTKQALERLRGLSPLDSGTKMSDDFLVPLFKDFYASIGSRNLMTKKNLYRLVKCLDPESVHEEVVEKLDAIAEIAEVAMSNIEGDQVD